MLIRFNNVLEGFAMRADMKIVPRVGDKVSFNHGEDAHHVTEVTLNVFSKEGEPAAWVTLR